MLRFYAHRLSRSEFTAKSSLTFYPPLTSSTVRVRSSTVYVHWSCIEFSGGCWNMSHRLYAHSFIFGKLSNFLYTRTFWEIHCFGVTSCRPIWMRNIGKTQPSLPHPPFLVRGNFFILIFLWQHNMPILTTPDLCFVLHNDDGKGRL